MEEHRSLLLHGEYFEAAANSAVAISLSQEVLLCNHCEKRNEKIVICLLKALLGWFTLHVPLTACREQKVPTCLFLLCVCPCLQL